MSEENEYQKWISISNKRLYTPTSLPVRVSHYQLDRQRRLDAVRKQVPFVSPQTNIFIYPGLVLIGGVSGKGKSTLLANLVAGFLPKRGSTRAVVITNEESISTLYDRAACIIEGKSFHRFYTGNLPESELEILDARVKNLIVDGIEVIDSAEYDMTCMEDVQSVFEYAANSGAGLAALDYYQTITHSKTFPNMEPFAVLKKMGGWLKTFVKNVSSPIVALVQLRPGLPNDSFKERVENDRQIFNHAHQCIEIQPNFETRQTKARVVKSRYGADMAQEVVLEYKDGRFMVEGDL